MVLVAATLTPITDAAVVLSRTATMPCAVLSSPAARLPTLKSLQSSVMLLPSRVIAVPDARLPARSLRRHHVPCFDTVAGRLSMNPMQLS